MSLGRTGVHKYELDSENPSEGNFICEWELPQTQVRDNKLALLIS